MPNLEQTRAAWEAQAEAYDELLTPLCMEAGRRALSLAGVQRGDKLIDVACGGGAVSIPAAELGADVLAVDYSASMVDLLTRKAGERGLPNLRVRLMDGTALDVEAGEFDVGCSQLGIMLFPDRAKGLKELARVVRPGGMAVMSVFGPPERVQPLSLFFEALAKVVPGAPSPATSPLFCLRDPELLKLEMMEAGFADMEVDRFETYLETASADALWTTVTAGAPAVTGILRSLSEEQRSQVRAALDGLLGAWAVGAGPMKLPMAFNIGVGVRQAADYP